MNEIPLPTGLRGDSSTPKQQEIIINAFLEKGDKATLSPRPGVIDKGTIYSKCRGQGVFNDVIYRVAADKLFKLEFNLLGEIVTTDTGQTISGSADCVMIPSFTRLLIMVKGGDAYSFNGTTATKITDILYKPSRSATFLNSLFVFIPSDGGPYFWSDINDPANISPGSFADAETLPDKNYSIIEYQGSLLIGGGETIERHTYNTALATFQRAQTATKNHGVVGDFARWGEDIVYIGRYQKGTMSIYSYNSTLAISSKAVDEVLNKYTVEQIRDVLTESFVWDGQPMVVWRLPEESIIYYGDFAFIQSGITGQDAGNWVGQYIASLEGKLICGDNQSPRIGELGRINTDYGETIEQVIQTYIRGTARENFLINRLVVGATLGASNDLKEMSLSVSEDGVIYGPAIWESMGVKGEYNKEMSWGQIGRFDNFCGLKLRWVTDISVPTDGVYFE